ncbi:alpha/beta hydrolase [Desulfopila aestuarii]|uniref:Phospholipase/carboxylesterase n=1 Tax=Desulfopila aestuarii DSM 18488 TaxID=1121416 RepID=A0A1M7Y074_9BACT|nr:dienelactone hydrolase family protein [Desulfopila aestuarii]SHO44802.1 phospholipase/carboxylesterase [Desulfopila aestuarii DSM 18488]
MPLLPSLEHETGPTPDAAVIWLHGLGADGHDFAPIVPQLHLPPKPGIRFIFPHAPAIPVTVNGGYVMPAWYDIYEMDIDRTVDSDQLLASATAVEKLIERELERGIASSRIILAGFSQGGAVAYQAGLSSTRPLAGLLAMSTYFATSDSITLAEANSSIPIEIHHGKFDPVVPEHLGKTAEQFLVAKGYSVNYRSYPMEHNVCPEQIADISSWIRNILL